MGIHSFFSGRFAIVTLILWAFLGLACSGEQPSSVPSPVNTQGEPIIGEQFQEPELEFDGEPRFMVLIELNEPALLSSAQKSSDGSLKVDEDLKERILAEQKEFKEKLMNLSPEIQILYEYQRVLNGFMVEAPQALAHEISALEVNFVEAVERFERPDVITRSEQMEQTRNLAQANSVRFLGVDKVHESLRARDKSGQLQPVRGQGVRVGIVDSGIDYTHTTMGGSGDISAFSSIDPSAPSEFFPNKKVVGGFDFAGTQFNPSSHLYGRRIATPDENPIDTEGHGTHVAGTVAGIGDGVNTYDGAAPEAELYALKVFGDEGGGTLDAIVIAALEYATDPNGDFNFDDRLHVLNLSLGGNFGKPHTLYSRAIRNITQGDILVVAAAGNSGAVTTIVGAPSTATEALSVAASVDNSDHLWKFPAIELVGKDDFELLSQATQGQTTLPLAETSGLKESVVPVGLAAEDFSESVAQALKGKVALIDRGQVSFDEKIQRAERAGAVGVIMVNNEAGQPFIMAGEILHRIPGVMISQEDGALIKQRLQRGETVMANFKPDRKVERPEIIDTIASFSSQGPRDLDALIKPEVAAPGYAIISAEAGGGNTGVIRFGTSMAAPHVAGVAALAVQYRPHLEARQLKSILMNSGVVLQDEDDSIYPISRQGAGRLQAFEALTTPVAALTPALSLGKVPVQSAESRYEVLQLQNLTDSTQTYTLSSRGDVEMSLGMSPQQLTLKPGEIGEVQVVAHLSVPEEEKVEIDRFIEVSQGGRVVSRVPVMAIVNRTTMMELESLELAATSVSQTLGAPVKAQISNRGEHQGVAFLFNLLGENGRKPIPENTMDVGACDLQSSGYRIVERDGQQLLQVAVKLHNPVTTWLACDVNVDFDVNGNGQKDKELVGTSPARFPGFQQLDLPAQASVLFDSHRLLQIFENYSKELVQQNPQAPQINFLPAAEQLAPFIGFTHSTVSIVEVPVNAFAGASEVGVRVSVSFNGPDIAQREDVLHHQGRMWKKISLRPEGQPYYEIPEHSLVEGFGQVSEWMKRGSSPESKLVAFFPHNEYILETLGFDSQSQVKQPQLMGGSFYP